MTAQELWCGFGVLFGVLLFLVVFMGWVLLKSGRRNGEG